MKISSNYKDLLSIINAAGVRYLIVGGYAVMIYTEPHYTKDLDIWIDRSDRNAQAVFKALAQFGAPLKGLSAGRLYRARVLSRDDLLLSKKAADRRRDRKHVRSLRKAK
jgi:hypothetical protein